MIRDKAIIFEAPDRLGDNDISLDDGIGGVVVIATAPGGCALTRNDVVEIVGLLEHWLDTGALASGTEEG